VTIWQRWPELFEVLTGFGVDIESCTVDSLGAGNINQTFLVRSTAASFVLQQINDLVFPDPRGVALNFSQLASHYEKKKELFGSRLQLASPVVAQDGQSYVADTAGKIWRAQTYLPYADNNSAEKLQPADAVRIGETLALFHLFLADMDMADLCIPLPGFHDLPGYLANFDRLLTTPASVKVPLEHDCQMTIAHFRERATTIEKAKNIGELKVRPIHGDPKLDNFIFNEQKHPVGLLDLDTVGPGHLQFDLGDCLRSCCNPKGEIATEKGKLFDFDLCEAFLKGYFELARDLFTDVEMEFIFDGLLLIPFELGLRFYTDHLEGDTYFKVQRAGDNLLRARVQFKLAREIEEEEPGIRSLVRSL
jgi:Ser/Thr protein kinase RdoA (MazF antagonist)